MGARHAEVRAPTDSGERGQRARMIRYENGSKTYATGEFGKPIRWYLDRGYLVELVQVGTGG